jgi:hypothetical protein
MEQPYGSIHSAECILCLECVSKCGHDAVNVEFG